MITKQEFFDWKRHDQKRKGYKEKALSKTNVSIPYRVGMGPMSSNEPVGIVEHKGASIPNISANEGSTAKISGLDVMQSSTATSISNQPNDKPNTESNSIESLMQTFNNFDAMANVKQAVITMLKNSSDVKSVGVHGPRTTPAVPAIKIASAPSISDEPKISMPLVNVSAQDSNKALDDVSRDVSDRRIAHIVTGGYSSIY